MHPLSFFSHAHTLFPPPALLQDLTWTFSLPSLPPPLLIPGQGMIRMGERRREMTTTEKTQPANSTDSNTKNSHVTVKSIDFVAKYLRSRLCLSVSMSVSMSLSVGMSLSVFVSVSMSLSMSVSVSEVRLSVGACSGHVCVCLPRNRKDPSGRCLLALLF